MAESKNLGKTSMGLDANVAGLLSYLVGIITGILFLVLEKENRFVRFHAMQSTIVSGSLIALSIILSVFMGIIPAVAALILGLLNIASLVLWIVCMVQAFQGKLFRLPVVGDIAAKQAGV